jgi:RNA polymerase sigma factor (sigma-70 family)
VQGEEHRFGRQCGELDIDELCSGFHERRPSFDGALQAPLLPSSAEQVLRTSSAANDAAAPSDRFNYVPSDLNDAVERWLPCMRRIAAAAARQQEVDDLLQEIWLELHRSWAAVVSADSPLAMALRIAKRRCNKSLRNRSFRLLWPFVRDEPSEVELAVHDLPQLDPERQLELSQALRLLLQILERLPPRQREAFCWRRMHGLTGDETAKVMNVTTKAAYALEEDARMKIESEWKKRTTCRRRSGE